MHAAPPPDWIVGGRYRLAELIGRGGVGAVYRAWDEVTKESVAVKHVVAASPAAWERFRREAWLQSLVRHPSIAESQGAWNEAGEWLMLMRYVHGPDLGVQLAQRGRPFGVRSVLEWAAHLLDALTYLHARGIVHHDIKPRNIKLDARRRAVLLDFGLAGQIRTLPGERPTGYTSAYSPPEQVLGADTDPRSDLYALGATLYELLARKSPPPAMERARAQAASEVDPLPPLDAMNPAVPRGVVALVRAATELDARQRPQDAVSMRRELLHAIDACDSASPLDDRLWQPRRVTSMGTISGRDDDTIQNCLVNPGRSSWPAPG